jgi:phage tail-like protein
MVAPKPNNPTTQQSNSVNPSNATAKAATNALMASAEMQAKAASLTSDSRVKNYVTTNRFFIEMGGSLVAAFSECSGVSVDIEKQVYQEGGVNDQQRISLGHTSFSDITLKRGLTNDKAFTKWFSDIFKRITLRRNVTIVTFNQAGKIIRSWCLIGAIPVGLKLPSLEADGDMVAVEELTLAFEGLKIGKQSVGGYPAFRDSKGYFASSKWK